MRRDRPVRLVDSKLGLRSGPVASRARSAHLSRADGAPRRRLARAPRRAAPQEPRLTVPRRLLLPASTLLAFLPSRRHAVAHALVVASEPAAGAALDAGPARVWVRFNSRIDQARSRLVLHGPENAQASLAVEDTADPVMLAARAEGVSWAPGAWRLRWQVLALDGHITRGDVPFTLRAR
jgi:copper resistance protein C